MYKGIFIILAIIIVVFCLNYITNKYTDDSVIILEGKLHQMKFDFLEKYINEEKIKKDIDDVFKEWYKRYNVLTYYIEHDELEKVENDLTMVKSCIDAKNFEDGVEHIDTSIFLMKHIKAKETFDFKNIF